MAEYKTGLWEKKSQKGNTYYSGKIKIGTEEYYINLFSNTNKTSEKAPDFNILIKNDINVLAETKQAEIPPKNESSEVLDTQAFIDFGNSIEFDDDIPF